MCICFNAINFQILCMHPVCLKNDVFYEIAMTLLYFIILQHFSEQFSILYHISDIFPHKFCLRVVHVKKFPEFFMGLFSRFAFLVIICSNKKILIH